jgi:hypothetical protein
MNPLRFLILVFCIFWSQVQSRYTSAEESAEASAEASAEEEEEEEAEALSSSSLVIFNISAPTWSISDLKVPFIPDNSTSPFMNGWSAFQLTEKTSSNVSIVYEGIDNSIFISAIGYVNATGENPLYCTLNPPFCWQVYHNSVRKNKTGIEEIYLLPNDTISWMYEKF